MMGAIDNICTVILPNEILLKEVKKLIDEGHDVTLRVRGVSMRPFLEDRRDKIVLTEVKNFKEGDVVLAEIAPGKYVFHRIVSINNGAVILRGDGNVRGVEMCRLENILAATKMFVRRGVEYSPQGWRWRCYSALWPQSSFARRVLLKVCRVLGLYK